MHTMYSATLHTCVSPQEQEPGVQWQQTYMHKIFSGTLRIQYIQPAHVYNIFCQPAYLRQPTGTGGGCAAAASKCSHGTRCLPVYMCVCLYDYIYIYIYVYENMYIYVKYIYIIYV